jgi:hypothetical protein
MFGLIGRLGIRDSARAACKAVRGGGPAGLRLRDVHPPEGLIVPTVTVDLEIPIRDGGTAELSPGFPLPPFLAWSYRVGKFGAMLRDRITK